jgi:glutamate-1-semialdehyde 2,1-aminomutase
LTTVDAAGIQALVSDLLGQRWVIDLFTDVAGRQGRSTELVDRLRRVDATSPVFWPFHAPQLPIAVTEAAGCRIVDADGNRYLDLHLGWGAQSLHGHNPAPVVAHVAERVGRGTGNGYFHPVELELATLLGELLPHCEKFAFFNSGTDATHAAIRIARAHTGRRLVAKVEGSLHGVHDLAAHNTAFWYHGNPMNPFPDIGPDGAVAATPAPAGVPSADPRDLLVLPHNDPRAIDLIQRRRDELACVIAEPVCSAFPFEEQSVPFVRQLAQTCRDMRVPFILDEVLTGFRCGIAGAAQRWDIPADLITYGKVITGLGLPLSAVGGRAEMLDIAQTSGLALTDFGTKSCLNTTHMGNYLSLCASLASLTLLREQGAGYYDASRARIGQFRERLAAFRASSGVPLHLVGFGDFIGGLSFLPDRPFRDHRDFAAAVNPIGLFLLTLLLRRRGCYAFSLPMVFSGGAHSAADLDELLAAATECAAQMKANGFPFLLPGTEAPNGPAGAVGS